MRDCLVMGSGRSGTSMVAGVLAKSGFETGDSYLTPRDANPVGFFEDEAVNRLNDRLLGRHLPRPFRPHLRKGILPWPTMQAPGWLATPPLDFTPEGEDEAIRQAVSSRPFAYKDPRFCWVLDAWRPHLPEGTVFVCVFREPGRTVASMMRQRETTELYERLKITPQWCLDVWKSAYRHVLERRLPTGGEWVFVHYDQVMSGDGLDRIGKHLGVELDRSHVSTDLKRSADRPADDRDAERLYERLMELATA